MKFITGDLELGIVTIKGTARPGNWNLMKRYKKHLQSSYRGDFDELEVKGFTRKIYRNASDRISH